MVLSEATSLRYNLGWYRARSSFADRPWPRSLRPALPMIQPCPASSFNEPAWGCGLTQNYSSQRTSANALAAGFERWMPKEQNSCQTQCLLLWSVSPL